LRICPSPGYQAGRQEGAAAVTADEGVTSKGEVGRPEERIRELGNQLGPKTIRRQETLDPVSRASR
jgi:hypothetical protein